MEFATLFLEKVEKIAAAAIYLFPKCDLLHRVELIFSLFNSGEKCHV
jgi:hypothetical protein